MRLVLAAHGSRAPAWSAVVAEIAAAVQHRRPRLHVAVGYVDVQAPQVVEVMTPHSVVVPLLLARGYHVANDIERPAAERGATVAEPVGPDPRLTDALVARLAEAGAPADVPVVLAAAGTSDPAARADVERQAGHLAAARGTAVHTAYAGGDVDLVVDVVRGLPGPVAVAPYLLGPGHFAKVVATVSAAWVSAPLGAHPAVIDVVLARYDASR